MLGRERINKFTINFLSEEMAKMFGKCIIEYIGVACRMMNKTYSLCGISSS